MDGGQFTIAKQGKWLNWAALNSSEIPNLQLLEAVMDEVMVLDH